MLRNKYMQNTYTHIIVDNDNDSNNNISNSNDNVHKITIMIT